MKFAILIMAWMTFGLGGLAPRGSGESGAKEGRAAPAFALKDSQGMMRSLAGYRGRPVALFFFCGCSWCREMARAWAPLQRGGALPQKSAGRGAAITLIVFSGGGEEAKAFAEEAGLDLAQTVLLADPDLKVTREKYAAEPCPRVFVVDGAGKIRYTNRHGEDAPRKASAQPAVAKTLDALRLCASDRPKRAQKIQE